MPRSDDTKVCNWNHSRCVFDDENSFVEFDKDKISPQSSCNCLPLCVDIKYQVKYEKTFDNTDSVHDSNGQDNTFTFDFPSPNAFDKEKFVAYGLQDFVGEFPTFPWPKSFKERIFVFQLIAAV